MGAALKLDANKIAETDSSATERVIWSTEARVELFWRFFILFFLAFQAVSTRKPRGIPARHFCAGLRTNVKIFPKFISFLATFFHFKSGSCREQAEKQGLDPASGRVYAEALVLAVVS